MLPKSTRSGLARFSNLSLKYNSASANTLSVEYAIRGAIFDKAMEYKARLAEGEHLHFDHLIQLNIGNPMLFDQKPNSFVREVLSLILNPALLQQTDIGY
jgi:alanine transaminase